MSTEDQMAIVDRLVTERAEAKRQMALLQHEAEGFAKMATQFAGPIMGACTAHSASTSLARLTEFQGVGGESKLHDVLTEYVTLAERIAGLTGKLRDAGVE